MADLTQTDFDTLLSELAEPESLAIDDSSEFEVDFNALLSEDLAALEELSVPDDVPSAEQLSEEANASTNEDMIADEFVDIDALIEQSDDTSLDYEPYDDVNMDVGLSEFDALLAGDNPTDVDAESGGYSAKLDLARAYIEIGDMDAALDAIDEVIANGPDEVQEEAQSLKAKLL
ncbi:FimV/HubP family polar landmark protein [Pseudoalteromonas ostreae]